MALVLLVVLGGPGTTLPSAEERRAGAMQAHQLHLNGFDFDPLLGPPSIPAGLTRHHAAAADRDYYIVQLDGPVTSGMKADLEQAGASILYYVPDDGFIVAADGASLASIRALPEVRWTGAYEPAFKLSPRLSVEYDAVVDAMNKPVSGEDKTPSAPKVDTRLRVPVQVLAMESSRIPEVDRAVRDSGATNVRTSAKGRGLIRAELPRSALEALAQHQAVLWIDREVPDQFMNDIARWTIQSNVPQQAPIHDLHGIHGTGQTVTVADSGIDYGHNAFRDPLNPTPGPNHRKVTAYYVPGDAQGDLRDNATNHGSHVSGTVAGDDGLPHVYDGDGVDSGDPDIEQNQPHDGQAFDAKLQVQDLSNDDGGGGPFPPTDYYNDLFGLAWSLGSSIHTNSWGPSCCGEYDTHGMQTDAFVWDHPDFLVIFAAGNGGSLSGTLNPHAAAKNTIAVGGSLNGASANDLLLYQGLSISGRGPTKDGRLKPDVIAPGQAIYSVHGCDPGPVCNDYRVGIGTSMAAPMVAGSAALVRQYFMDGWYPTGQPVPANGFTPSAALLKATLLNSAVEMTGNGTHLNGELGYPNTNEGWGRILLENALYFQGDNRSLMAVDEPDGVATGETLTYQFGVGDPTQPLEVTLVWSDQAAIPAAGLALVNDLDLAVTAPDGTFYQGNAFVASTPGRSKPVPAQGFVEPDRRNNVEGVILPSGLQVGAWTVSVHGFNVPMGGGSPGRQPFALVVTGGGPTKAGAISIDRDRYTAGATVQLTVIDTDLNVSPGAPDTCSIVIQSDTELAGETVLLTETSAASGIFEGTIQTVHGTSPVAGDGRLQVQNGNTILATYYDVDNGAGGSSTRTDTALVDEALPVISGVNVTEILPTRATIQWQTNESSDSKVTYGLVLPPQTALADASTTLTHALTIKNLLPGLTYFFKVGSTDPAGNVATDDNGGAFYQLTTPAQSSNTANNDWPTFRNDLRREGASPSRFMPPFTPVWTSPALAGTISNGSSLAGGVLYTATSDGHVRARNPYSGVLLWERALGATNPSSVQVPPSVQDGVAYVPFRSGPAGALYALDAATGAILWTTTPDVSYSEIAAPAIDGGLVIAATLLPGNQVMALNPANGSVVWSAPFPDVVRGLAVDQGRVIVAIGNGQTTGLAAALSETTGLTLWSTALPAGAGAGPTVGSGKIFVATANDALDSGSMIALDAGTGSIAWQVGGLGMVKQSPAFDGSNLYFAAFGNKQVGRNRLYALRAADGASAWERSIASRSVGSPALAFGLLYDFAFDGSLRVLDTATGFTTTTIALDPFTAGQPASSSPIASGGWLWVSDGAGAVHGLQGVLADYDGDGDPDASDCAPTNPAVNHGVIESTPSHGGAAGVCNDGIDNDCDGIVDLDCAVDIDTGGQGVGPGTITSGSIADLKATSTQSPATYETLTETGSPRKLTTVKNFTVTDNSSLKWDVVVEGFHNAGSNDDFTVSYKIASAPCPVTDTSNWIDTGIALTSTVDTNTTLRASVGTLTPSVVCVRIQDTKQSGDSVADVLTLDRLYLQPSPNCVDADGDGYTTSCTGCNLPTCPVLDCDDANAGRSPGLVEGPPGYPTCFDGIDNNCNDLVDGADHLACVPPPPPVFATAEPVIGPGIAWTGTVAETYESDDTYEVIKETTQSGKSKLKAVWEFDNVQSGSNHTLQLEAHRSNLADDTFQFYWSTNGTSYTAIPGALINHPFEIQGGGQAYPFGAGSASGTIYIKAEGSGTGTHIDQLSVDFMVLLTDP